MKKLLFLAVILSLPLAQVVRADNDNDNLKKRKHQVQAAAEHRPQQAVRQPVQQTQRRVAPVQRTVARPPRTVAPVQHQTARSEANFAGRNRPRTPVVNQANNRNQAVNRGRTNSQVSARRNRGNGSFDRNSFTVARSRVSRVPHDRNWWRSHYHTTFVLFGGGYFYWDAGYWYPAYGYSPLYNSYSYDEPIYGYNDLAPGQVLENVQLALRDQGYYDGPIDGLIGPQTRAALVAFQRDNGLEVTSAVDEPTLVTLGLA